MARNPWPILGLVFLAACSRLPEETSLPTGALIVQTLTSGNDIDPDGYIATVDDATSEPVATNGSAVFTDLAFGNHTVELAGEASNCTVDAPNPRDVEVTAVAIAQITFEVTCIDAGAPAAQAVTRGDTPDFKDTPSPSTEADNAPSR